MTASMGQPDFRDLMRSDPRAAFEKATGQPAPNDVIVSVKEEGADAWEFVLPATAIEAELPAPAYPREVLENEVYALLRDDPALRARVVADPKGFLAEKFQLDLAVNVREEGPGEVLIILPYSDNAEELPDAALDLIAGGDQITGGSTCPSTAKA